MQEKNFVHSFEDFGDMTLNLDKVLLAEWFYTKVLVRLKSGYAVEVTGVGMSQLWNILKARYTTLSETTILNVHEIALIKWEHGPGRDLQAQVSMDGGTNRVFNGYEAWELRRVVTAVQSESR